MAIKIIRTGKLPEERMWGGRCFNCKTVAEWLQGDGESGNDQRDGDWARIPCPLTGCTGKISGSLLDKF